MSMTLILQPTSSPNTAGNANLIVYYIYYRFIVRFPIGVDFLFMTFLPHFFLSWTSSLSISSSAISASTLSNHVLVVFCLQLYTPYISSPNPHHMSMLSQSTGSSNLSLHEVELSGNNRCHQIEINGFLPRVRSKRLN